VSTTTTGHNYGVGLLAILVASGAGILYYQMYYVPEMFATPDVDEHILHPVKSTTIEMIMGSANAEQQDNYVPKLVQIQLTIDNHVIWLNVDETAHTVTPDSHDKSITVDPYSGAFGSTGVIKPGEAYDFLFTDAPPNGAKVIEYHCDPHPWMTGTLEITKSRF